MKQVVELPLLEPMYSAYQCQSPGTAVLAKNPSIRNWYLSEIMILSCTRNFLHGRTTPEMSVEYSAVLHNPYLEQVTYPMQFLGEYVNVVIRNLIDTGYYVYFDEIDDYYIRGKSWYGKRHFSHDGLICGYNQENKTYCMFAYDSNWICRKFWTPQEDFEKGRKAMFRKGIYGSIYGVKPMADKVKFSTETALKKIAEYLDSSMEKYPEEGEGMVYGIVVQEYLAKYVGKLLDGTIPYERMDRRVFRLIWEHKKVIWEQIQSIEKALELTSDISSEYEILVKEAETMRMLYAAHHMRRRDSLLLTIQMKLLKLKENEQVLLEKLLERARYEKRRMEV